MLKTLTFMFFCVILKIERWWINMILRKRIIPGILFLCLFYSIIQFTQWKAQRDMATSRERIHKETIVLLNKGIKYCEENKYDKALKMFHKISSFDLSKPYWSMQDDPFWRDVYAKGTYYISRCYEKKNEPEKAKAYYLKAKALDPNLEIP